MTSETKIPHASNSGKKEDISTRSIYNSHYYAVTPCARWLFREHKKVSGQMLRRSISSEILSLISL